jgi:ABC-2 type transport system permease protein
MRRLRRIVWLGLKETASLRRDRVMLGLLVWAFSLAILVEAGGVTGSVRNASVGVVDEDGSALSRSLIATFQPPEFQPPVAITDGEIDAAMDAGRFLFVLVVPPRFEADLRAGRGPALQLLVDATAMEQAGLGHGYMVRLMSDEIARFLRDRGLAAGPAVALVTRSAFNPNRDQAQFRAVVSLINHVTIMAMVLTGAAVMREREHGTIEHLLALPLTPFDIAAAKILANAAMVLVAATLSLLLVIEGLMAIPVEGSRLLFVGLTAIYLVSAAAFGVFLATLSRSMAQFALLAILAVMAIQFLSGGETPVEGQPGWLQSLTLLLPSRHYVEASQAIVFRGAPLSAVAGNLLGIVALGAALLVGSLTLFRRSVATGR